MEETPCWVQPINQEIHRTVTLLARAYKHRLLIRKTWGTSSVSQLKVQLRKQSDLIIKGLDNSRNNSNRVQATHGILGILRSKSLYSNVISVFMNRDE